jgi:hypothetical protein
MGVEDEIDALYGLPLEQFTEKRNELAARLRKEDRDASQAVKALAKPPLVAWAVNQLHRRQPQEMEALLSSGERMRQGQSAALQGGGTAAMREATKEQRALVDELARAAGEILSAAGHAASDSTLVRLRRTLEALAASGWGEIRPGRLDRELEPPGMDALAALLAGGGAPGPTPKAPAPRAAKAEEDDGAERRRAAALLAEAEAEDAARQKDLEAARESAERAEQAAAAAERDASQLEHAAKEARAAATRAARVATAARATLDAASNRATSAAKELGRLRAGTK